MQGGTMLAFVILRFTVIKFVSDFIVVVLVCVVVIVVVVVFFFVLNRTCFL